MSLQLNLINSSRWRFRDSSPRALVNWTGIDVIGELYLMFIVGTRIIDAHNEEKVK